VISLSSSAELVLNATSLVFNTYSTLSFSMNSKVTLIRGASLSMPYNPSLTWYWGNIELVDRDTTVWLISGSLSTTPIYGCGTVQIRLYYQTFTLANEIYGTSATCPLKLVQGWYSGQSSVGIKLSLTSMQNTIITMPNGGIMEWYGSTITGVEFHSSSLGTLSLTGGSSTPTTVLRDVLLDLTYGGYTIDMKSYVVVRWNNVTMLVNYYYSTPINLQASSIWYASNSVRILSTYYTYSAVITINRYAELYIDDSFYCQITVSCKRSSCLPPLCSC
jgi:hypothetical protein